MKLSTKLLMLVAAALLGVVLLAALSLHTLRDALIDSRREEIVVLLTKAEHLVDSYRAMQTSGTLTQEQAQQQAKAALAALNANSKSYFWVTTSDGVNLVHPNAKFIGTRARQPHDQRPDRQRGVPRGHGAIAFRARRRADQTQPRRGYGAEAAGRGRDSGLGLVDWHRILLRRHQRGVCPARDRAGRDHARHRRGARGHRMGRAAQCQAHAGRRPRMRRRSPPASPPANWTCSSIRRTPRPAACSSRWAT